MLEEQWSCDPDAKHLSWDYNHVTRKPNWFRRQLMKLLAIAAKEVARRLIIGPTKALGDTLFWPGIFSKRK